MAHPGRIRLAVLFGGISAEHEVSLRSARAVLEHLDPDRYDLRPVGITRGGGWLGATESRLLLAGDTPAAAGGPPYLPDGTDCLFPVLHGPGGEDGTLQGWAELMGVPCVGSPCLGSALAMDKGVAKRVLRDAGVPVLPWEEVTREQFAAAPETTVARLAERLPGTCFVKPMALGSSIGISRADDAAGMLQALEFAFRFGRRALVEPEYRGRELEVAVLEEQPLRISPPGEVRTASWYDYQAKYEDDSAQLLMPAPNIAAASLAALSTHAGAAFEVLRLSGMARIDFFLGADGGVVLNEVNTIPGFTSISMYARLLELTGLPFAELCDRLVQIALRRAASEGELQAEHRTA